MTIESIVPRAADEREDPSAAVAAFIADTTFDTLPEPVIERVKKSILDVLAVGVYGYTFDATKPLLVYAKRRSASDEASIFCGGGKASAFDAAMVNGTYVHTTEFAEGFTRALVHPGNSVIPGLLALCERDRRSGRDMLTGASVGYELNIRQGLSVGPPLVLEQGIHPPAILGAIASAAACSKALALSMDGVRNTLGIAACQTPTALMAAANQHATVKDLFQGYNSALGILAADLAVAGLTGLRDWIKPWYRAIPRKYNLAPISDRLGEYWHVSSGGIRVKTRPVMAMAQPTLFGLHDLLSERRIDHTQIESVLVESSNRIELGNIQRPRDLVSARASIQFLTAVALVHQERFVNDKFFVRFLQPEMLDDPAVVGLADRVSLGVDPEFDHNLERAKPSGDPAHYMKFEARVTIRMRDGSQIVAYKDVFAAGTGNMSRERMEEKFRACTEGVMPESRAAEVIDAVWNLDSLSDAGELARLMASW